MSTPTRLGQVHVLSLSLPSWYVTGMVADIPKLECLWAEQTLKLPEAARHAKRRVSARSGPDSPAVHDPLRPTGTRGSPGYLLGWPAPTPPSSVSRVCTLPPQGPLSPRDHLLKMPPAPSRRALFASPGNVHLPCSVPRGGQNPDTASIKHMPDFEVFKKIKDLRN